MSNPLQFSALLAATTKLLVLTNNYSSAYRHPLSVKKSLLSICFVELALPVFKHISAIHSGSQLSLGILLRKDAAYATTQKTK
jgi:putative effector of murein hydrolase